MALSKDLDDLSDRLRCLTNGFLWEQFQQFLRFIFVRMEQPAYPALQQSIEKAIWIIGMSGGMASSNSLLKIGGQTLKIFQ